jgi:hypothetical protein
VVGNTDGEGAYIRKTPNFDDKIKAWPDGTEVTVVADDREEEGTLWKNVDDPDGNVGWIPSKYLLAP